MSDALYPLSSENSQRNVVNCPPETEAAFQAFSQVRRRRIISKNQADHRCRGCSCYTMPLLHKGPH